MRAGADYRLLQTTRTGQPIITNEIHTATAGTFTSTDTFTLNNQDAVESSIVIEVSTVVPTGVNPTFVTLDNVSNYTVTPIGSSFRITINSIPSGVCQIADCDPLVNPSFQFTFRASYSITQGDIRLDTTSYGFNLRFELFKSLLSPYFSYYKTTQKLLSGTLNGGTEDSTNTTAGLQVQKLPFIFMAEYQNFTSNTNPFRAVRSELDYRKDLSLSVSLFGKLNYSNTNYPLGQAANTTGYTETRYGANVVVQKTFYSPRMAISLGLSYDQSTGLATSKTYALNTGLTLRSGRTEILFSGRASRSDIVNAKATQELTSEFFFLTFKRKFF